MTLQERLDAYKAESARKRPAEALAIMHRATEDLQRSGILDRVIKVGSAIPEFVLPNQSGENISSAALHSRGPLVLTFYRGVW